MVIFFFLLWVGERVVFFSHAVWCCRVRSVGHVIFVRGGFLYGTVIVECRRDVRIFKERILGRPGSLLVRFLSDELYFWEIFRHS